MYDVTHPTRPRAATIRNALLAALAGLLLLGLVPTGAAAQTLTRGQTEDFATYDGERPLSSFAPGEVLRTRTGRFHVTGVPTPVRLVQLLYRTQDAQGRPSANVTSVLLPPGGTDGREAVSYQSFYDSLDPADSPSRIFAGDVTFGGLVANAETLFLAPLLLKGYPVIASDTQGQTANFAAGPEYATNTLDSIRAAQSSEATGLRPSTRIGMLGYSGGAIGTNWAAALAPSYAPDVDEDLVGAAQGGLLVAPANNLDYISGSTAWAGIGGMAIVGLGRAYGIDFGPYLSEDGKRVLARLEKASILNAYLQYPGLSWRKLAKPQYADPNSVPEFVEVVNRLNLGQRPTPTTPLLIAQGRAGWLEGTSGSKLGIGAGDGVMIAGDVRTLARQYCTGGTRVKYQEYGLLSHIPAAAAWAPGAIAWLGDRFRGKAAPSSCGSIPAGNSLAPEVGVPPGR